MLELDLFYDLESSNNLN